MKIIYRQKSDKGNRKPTKPLFLTSTTSRPKTPARSNK